MADIASMDSQCEPAFDGDSVSGAVSVPAGAKAGVSEGNYTRVDALRTHRLEDTIPLREANELTELAEHINFLSETERRLRQQEMALQAERERMIRDLSHDIRTPLTAILSYSDYMSRKDGYTDAELREYFSLVRKKAAQMKDMTDRLLEGSKRNVEPVENGRLLMEQLAGEWEEILGGQLFLRDFYGELHRFSGRMGYAGDPADFR